MQLSTFNCSSSLGCTACRGDRTTSSRPTPPARASQRRSGNDVDRVDRASMAIDVDRPRLDKRSRERNDGTGLLKTRQLRHVPSARSMRLKWKEMHRISRPDHQSDRSRATPISSVSTMTPHYYSLSRRQLAQSTIPFESLLLHVPPSPSPSPPNSPIGHSRPVRTFRDPTPTHHQAQQASRVPASQRLWATVQYVKETPVKHAREHESNNGFRVRSSCACIESSGEPTIHFGRFATLNQPALAVRQSSRGQTAIQTREPAKPSPLALTHTPVVFRLGTRIDRSLGAA